MGRYLHYLTYHPSRWAGRERNGMADDIIGNGIDKRKGIGEGQETEEREGTGK